MRDIGWQYLVFSIPGQPGAFAVLFDFEHWLLLSSLLQEEYLTVYSHPSMGSSQFCKQAGLSTQRTFAFWVPIFHTLILSEKKRNGHAIKFQCGV